MPDNKIAIECTGHSSNAHAERTKAGICKARDNGTTWGSYGRVLAQKNKESAYAFAVAMRPMILDLMIAGCTGPTSLARELNKLSVPARAGGRWYPVTMFRLMRLLSSPELTAEVHEGRAKRVARQIAQLLSHD